MGKLTRRPAGGCAAAFNTVFARVRVRLSGCSGQRWLCGTSGRAQAGRMAGHSAQGNLGKRELSTWFFFLQNAGQSWKQRHIPVLLLGMCHDGAPPVRAASCRCVCIMWLTGVLVLFAFEPFWEIGRILLTRASHVRLQRPRLNVRLCQRAARRPVSGRCRRGCCSNVWRF